VAREAPRRAPWGALAAAGAAEAGAAPHLGADRKPKGPPRRVFRELEARDELVANMLLEMTWFPTSELWLEPAGGKRTRVVLEYGRVVIGVAVLDEYGDAAVLRALAVRATCRRQKHGRALVEYIVRHAYEVGVGRMYAVSATQWFVEAVGFELRKRTMLPEDARRLPGIIDAPSNAFVFELTPTQSGRRVPRRSVPRSAVEAVDPVRTEGSALTRASDSPTSATRAPTLAQGAPKAWTWRGVRTRAAPVGATGGRFMTLARPSGGAPR
jgi:GNAT superfamily N-acetyltransferase